MSVLVRLKVYEASYFEAVRAATAQAGLERVVIRCGRAPRSLSWREPSARWIKRRVTLAVGSDNVSDSSVLEVEHLHLLGVVDPLALLKLWTEDTPTAPHWFPA